MEAEFFRIGNLVLDFDNEPCEVYEIHKDKYTTTINGYKVDGACLRQFKPIPLTEEWLLKFGFKHNEGMADSWLFFNGFPMNNHMGGWHFNDLSISVLIKYVHQLQNLYFALTGEELKLNDK